MPRLRGRSRQVFDACCDEIHAMFSGQISEEELARRSVEIAKRFGLSTDWARYYRSGPQASLELTLAERARPRANGRAE